MVDDRRPEQAVGSASAVEPAASDLPREIPSKWKLLAAFWVTQAIVTYLAGALWLGVMGSSLEAVWDGLTSPTELFHTLTDDGLALVMGVYIAGVTALQALLLWPVRKPRLVHERGTSLWLSIGLAGLAIAAMWMAALLSLVSLIYLAATGQVEWISELTESIRAGKWLFFAPLLFGWAVATPLLVVFCRGGGRERLLSRIATRILLGTAVEVVAIIPLAVMVRRRTNCCCDTGTFWALTLLGTVGVVLAGPAVAYTILSRRRRRWYADRCEVCGYDMTALRNADRCPECGCGWAYAPAGTAGRQS